MTKGKLRGERKNVYFHDPLVLAKCEKLATQSGVKFSRWVCDALAEHIKLKVVKRGKK